MSERQQAGTKLANSVRQAKMKQVRPGKVVTRREGPAEQDMPAVVFASRRVWPD